MEIYSVWFKCNFCGEKYRDRTLEVPIGTDLSFIFGKATPIRKKDVHHCDAGEYGVSNFIGITKGVGNNEENSARDK
jgi:hypothetical protein